MRVLNAAGFGCDLGRVRNAYVRRGGQLYGRWADTLDLLIRERGNWSVGPDWPTRRAAVFTLRAWDQAADDYPENYPENRPKHLAPGPVAETGRRSP